MRKILIILIVIFILFGAGVFFYFYSKPGPIKDAWKKEILWAQECGEAGIACCKDRESACSYGLECCKDPSDPDRNICLDDCSCGTNNKFCCTEDPICYDGFACSDGFCVPCGQELDPCCYGEDVCIGGLVCSNNNKCVYCGFAGNPCCQNEPACIEQNNFNESRTECQNGVCILCGSDNSIACRNEPVCNNNHLLNNSFCLACGEYNQPCCNELSGTGYECNPSKSLSCHLGFCID